MSSVPRRYSNAREAQLRDAASVNSQTQVKSGQGSRGSDMPVVKRTSFVVTAPPKGGTSEPVEEPRTIQVVEENILALRDPKDFSPNLERVIDMMTVLRSTIPVGSFKFEAFRFPGDVDMFESVSSCCDLASATDDIASRIRNIAKRVRLDDDAKFSEFKAGVDKRFDFGLQDVSGGDDDAIDLYDAEGVRHKASQLRDSGLLTNDEAQEITSLAVDDPSLSEYQKLYEAARRHYVLRWTMDDLKRGYKTLSGGDTVSLAEALTHPTKVKMDVWAFVDGRWIEVTNFFHLKYITENGDEIDISPPMGNYLKSVRADIEKYACRNALKVAKRTWLEQSFLYNTARTKEDRSLAEKRLKLLAPLFNSKTSLLSQLMADAETLEGMAQTFERPPVRKMTQHALRMAKLLKEALPRDQRQQGDELIQPIYEAYEAYDRAKRSPESIQQFREVVAKQSEEIMYFIKPIVHQQAREYLLERGFDPSRVCLKRHRE